MRNVTVTQCDVVVGVVVMSVEAAIGQDKHGRATPKMKTRTRQTDE